MAGKQLSFVIALKFLTENFNKGTNKVKASIRAMQREFMALSAAVGAGALGFTNLLSRMVDTAKETNRVTIALKNVSKSTEEYASSQQWLIGLSKKYGVEINSLTSGYTKFKAAADISNMSLDDQRKIFESVSRAAVAFGMSSEDQRGVFMALAQMMSKGKVMAEELRLQMSERMPIALQAMAEAAGTTVEGLDAMMKRGEVLSKDVLPKFADALNRMIPNVELDTLNKSLTDLKNAFTELVKGLDVEGKFKSVVDVAASLMSKLASNVKSVSTAIKIALVGALGKGLASLFRNLAVEFDRAIAHAEKLIKKGKATGVEMEVAAMKASTGWSRAFNVLAFSAKRAGAALKAMFMSNIFTGALMAVTWIADKLYEIYSRTQRIKKALAGDIDPIQEQADLEKWQKLLASKDQNTRAGAISQINNILGTELKTEEEINKAIEERIRLRQLEARLALVDAELPNAKERYMNPTVLSSATKGQAKAGREYADLLSEQQYLTTEIAKITGKKQKEALAENLGGGVKKGKVEIPIVLKVDEIESSLAVEPDLSMEDVLMRTADYRDKSGDWKLSKLGIMEADLEQAKKYFNELTAYASATGEDLTNEINAQFAKVTNLGEAFKLAELASAAKDVQEELQKTKFDVFEDSIDGVSGLVDAFARLNEVMEEDGSAWEKISAMFEVFKSSAESVISVISSIQRVKELEAQANAITAQQNVASAQGEAVANATKEGSKMPFPYNLVAIATGIAAVMSAFAALPKFANGGVVGGNSPTGDKILARLNSGEGVLTRAGMGTLYNMMNGGGNMRISGEFKVKGRDLVAAIDQNNKYTNRTK